MSTRQKATVSLAWFAIVVGTLLGVGTIYYSVVSLSAGSPEFAAILLFIGGVFATTLMVSGLRLRHGSGPARVEVPWGARTGARRKASDVIGLMAMICGVLLGLWSIYNGATRPKPNELDVIDLLLGLAIAVTLVVISIRLWQRRSPWRVFLLGFAVSLALFVQALRVAFRTFN